MASKESEKGVTHESVELFDGAMFMLTPLIGVLVSAFAAAQSETPQKWLIRTSVWLIVVLTRYIAGKVN